MCLEYVKGLEYFMDVAAARYTTNEFKCPMHLRSEYFQTSVNRSRPWESKQRW